MHKFTFIVPYAERGHCYVDVYANTPQHAKRLLEEDGAENVHDHSPQTIDYQCDKAELLE